MEDILPSITTKMLEIAICVSRDESDYGISIPRIAIIQLCGDGSIFMREYIDDPRRNEQDNDCGYMICHNWAEFKVFDTTEFAPAQMIEDWANKENIDLKWLGVG